MSTDDVPMTPVAAPDIAIPTFPFTFVSVPQSGSRWPPAVYAALRNGYWDSQAERDPPSDFPVVDAGLKRRRDDLAAPAERDLQRPRVGDALNPRILLPPPTVLSWKSSKMRSRQPEVRGLQGALHLHIRIAMKSLLQADLPRQLSADERAQREALCEAQFLGDKDAAVRISETPVDSVTTTVQYVNFLIKLHHSSGHIATKAGRVVDNHLRVIFNAITVAGLPAFEADCCGNEESLYNLVHEHLAIHTFRAVAMAWAYLTVASFPLRLLDGYDLLRSLYRSYVYGFMGRRARREY
ncbi:hypothetical protein C8R47DRAFT_1224145 [Mycena vitilis]|nr:hypothetical protein C8R47DRAFT_1224145 [Mycena vitilis]